MRQKSLIRQFLEILLRMRHFGESKHTDKIKNSGKPDLRKIYSYDTFTAYKKSVMRFAKYVRNNYGCRTPEEAKKYVAEYLRHLIAMELSAWTIHQDASALAKVYQCSYRDFGVVLPQRRRCDIRRNLSTVWKREDKFPLLVRVSKSNGLRKHELEKLEVDDVIAHAEMGIWVHVRQGKGGRERYVRALDDSIIEAREIALAAGRKRIFESIPKDAPIHAYRRLYAQTLYNIVARDCATLSREEVYHCRAEMTGIVYDRRAMQIVSQNLGHNRIDVIVTYLRPLDRCSPIRPKKPSSSPKKQNTVRGED